MKTYKNSALNTTWVTRLFGNTRSTALARMTATLRNPQLKGLLELLTVSLQEIEAAYHAGGHDIPSLDSVESGPYDVPEKMSFQLTKAIQMVEGACAQICASVAPPGHIVLNVRPHLYVIFVSDTLLCLESIPSKYYAISYYVC